MNDSDRKILEDAVKVLADLVMAAATGGAALPVLMADAPTAKDALERLLLKCPPINAPELDPVARAEADAEAQADGDAKFPPTK